jgi:hypothetical protein
MTRVSKQCSPYSSRTQYFASTLGHNFLLFLNTLTKPPGSYSFFLFSSHEQNTTNRYRGILLLFAASAQIPKGNLFIIGGGNRVATINADFIKHGEAFS